MLRSEHPVIAVSAVRTGCGKSQIARWISNRLQREGFKVAVLRHPMPYGDLLQERVQRFASMDDIAAAKCSVEEREEYEPHVTTGNIIFAGVDYAAILERADAEANIIVWDGGNNDFPFIRPDLHIVVVDALRPKHLDTHHPGEAVLRMADIVVINKIDSATADAVQSITDQVAYINPRALVVRAASPVRLDHPAAVKGRRVLVVEDGPTLTRGGMAFGAGYVAAVAAGARDIVDPRLSADPQLQRTFATFPHLGKALPAMGYSESQVAALRRTIDASDAEVVVAGTPIDLGALVKTIKPIVRAHYGYAETGEQPLGSLIDAFLLRTINSVAKGAAE
jgi:predicted GTPase